MPTNEERREAAQRFRAIDYDTLEESAICAFLDALGETWCLDWAEIAHSIADLIEPEPERTCHDVTPWGDFFTCSECNGQVMLRPDVRWPDDGKILRTPTLIDGEGLGMRYPRFCPNCGAKVVDE